jgi:hypothetical protein
VGPRYLLLEEHDVLARIPLHGDPVDLLDHVREEPQELLLVRGRERGPLRPQHAARHRVEGEELAGDVAHFTASIVLVVGGGCGRPAEDGPRPRQRGLHEIERREGGRRRVRGVVGFLTPLLGLGGERWAAQGERKGHQQKPTAQPPRPEARVAHRRRV